MLNYSQKGKNPLRNIFNHTQDYSYSHSSLNSNVQPCRPPNIIIPNHTPDPYLSPTLTPKTSRYGYEPRSAHDQSFNRTATDIIDPDKYKKINSFHTATKLKEPSEPI